MPVQMTFLQGTNRARKQAGMRELRRRNPWTSGNMPNVGADAERVDVTVPQWEWRIPLGDHTVKPTGKGQFQETDIKKKKKGIK